MLSPFEYKQTTEYLNKALIESFISYTRNHNAFVSIAKVAFPLDLNDAYGLKNLFSYLSLHLDFAPMFITENGEIIFIFKDLKIHQAKAKLRKMWHIVFNSFSMDINSMGLTMIDKDDDFKSLATRVDNYFSKSKFSNQKGGVYYATKDFDAYDTNTNFTTLVDIFDKQKLFKLHNFYHGVPLSNRSALQKVVGKDLVVKVEEALIPFYENEEFVFIEHDKIANIIKARIKRVNPIQSSLVLSALQFLEDSPLDRTGVRIEPDENIYTNISVENQNISRGRILNISDNSIVLELNRFNIKQLERIDNMKDFFQIKMQIPTKKSFITTIKTKAMLFREDEGQVVINIYPNALAKTKILSYINMQQANILNDLRNKLKIDKD